MKSTTCKEETLSRGTASEFITERRYLKNVTPKTLAWYGHSFKAFDGALESEATIKQRIVELRNRGVSAISVNTWLRCINAYLKWSGLNLKIPRLKEEQKILATLTDEQARRLISFKPTGRNMTRAHVVALMILDGGYRISELLGLQVENVDFDNLVIKVRGKGNKHRLIPLSIQMRKVLYRYVSKNPGRGLVFGTSNGTQVSVRNFERDLSQLGAKIGITGIRFSPHVLRHHFSCHYLRNGGNLEFLRRILGHSSILTTQKYLGSLGVADLQVVHDRLSALAGGTSR